MEVKIANVGPQTKHDKTHDCKCASVAIETVKAFLQGLLIGHLLLDFMNHVCSSL